MDKREAIGYAAGSGAGAVPGLRVAHGYDLHRLDALRPRGNGRALIVGGVVLEHDRGPVAHSDGDVLYHAVVDALMGAIAGPDIGQMFPDNLPENDGRDSADFVREAARRLKESGWEIVNMDCTVILERPRLSPVKERIRENLSRLLGVEGARINVKGKSHEQVDAVGEGRAIESHVVALLWKAR